MYPHPQHALVGIADLPLTSTFAAFTPFIKGIFSQWHLTRFIIEGMDFSTAEQWMMFSKATLFDNPDIAQQILQTDDPSVQKRLGQMVRGFDQAIWDHWKIDVVYRGNMAKFGQNDGALRQLRNTGSTLLVEANPRDWVWGSGCPMDEPMGHAPQNWRGENLLGLILTKVRQDLSAGGS